LHDAGPTEAPPGEPTAPAAASEALPVDPKAFWTPAALPGDFFQGFQAPPVTASLPKRLGNFPFWRGQERFLDALEPIYRQAGQEGMRTLLGEAGDKKP
jgi:uncharacterized Zn finger protein